MNHEQAEKLLGALIFEDLDEQSKARLLATLETDADLRESLADLRMALKVTTDAVQSGSDPVLSDARLKRLEALSRSRRHSRVMLTARWAGLAACMAIAAAAFWGSSFEMILSPLAVTDSASTHTLGMSDAASLAYETDALGRSTASRGSARPMADYVEGASARVRRDDEQAADPTWQMPVASNRPVTAKPEPPRQPESAILPTVTLNSKDGFGRFGDASATENGLYYANSNPFAPPADQPAPEAWYWGRAGGSRDKVSHEALLSETAGVSSGQSVDLYAMDDSKTRSALADTRYGLGIEGPVSVEIPMSGDQPRVGVGGGGVHDGRMMGEGMGSGMMGGGVMGGSMGGGMMGGMQNRRAGLEEDFSRPGAEPGSRAPELAARPALDPHVEYNFSLPGIELVDADSDRLAKAKSERKESSPEGHADGRPTKMSEKLQKELSEVTTLRRVQSNHGVLDWGEEVALQAQTQDRLASRENDAAETQNDSSANGESETRVAKLGDIPLGRGLFRQGNEAARVRGGSVPSSRPVEELSTQLVVQPTKALSRTSSEFTLPPASRFKMMPVNPWVLTEQDALSTFALDVDTASYALCRQYIQHGFLPPAGAVRMEEFVNAFDYAYPQRSEPTFSVMAEGTRSPFAEPGQALSLVKIAVKARTVGRDQRKAAHLVFVVDASASMGQADRLPLIQQGLSRLVEELGTEDRVSLVSCSDQARLLLDRVSARDRDVVKQAVHAIQPSGSTNLLSGLQLGYATARASYVAGQINQVILCSDGVANVGATEAESVLEAMAEDRKQGIMLMCVGVGYGAYNDVLLEALANQGDGRYVFVDGADQVEHAFVTPLASALQTVAKDARIQVKFDPDAVRRYRLIGYENRDMPDEKFRDDTVDAGEVGSGQCATALYEIELTNTPTDSRDLGTVFVRYQDTDTQQFEEIARPLTRSMIRPRTVSQSPRFFLAACAARFAEWLRQSEHAKATTLDQILSMTDEISAALPLDQDIRALADLVRQADGLPRAP